MNPRTWAQLWSRLQHYLSEGLWVQELEPATWTTRGVRLLQFALMVGEGFVRDLLLLRASALTYFTVLSIVPLLAIVSSVTTALGVTEDVVGTALDQIRGAFPEVAEKVEEFLANANIRALGSFGALLASALQWEAPHGAPETDPDTQTSGTATPKNP